MITTTQHTKAIGRAYDREEIRVYIKDHKFLFIGWEEVVKATSIKNELVLNLQSERMPDKVFFNGKEIILQPKE